jgi:hypothetical protein
MLNSVWLISNCKRLFFHIHVFELRILLNHHILHYLRLGITHFLLPYLILIFVAHLWWGLAYVELRADLHLERRYSLILFLVGTRPSFSLIRPLLGANYLAGSRNICGTFLVSLNWLFSIGFLGILQSSRFAHLTVISCWGVGSSLHLGGH